MTINDLELYLVEVPCAELGAPVRSVLARLMTDSGREGWGEAPIRLQAAQLAGRRDALLPVLAGRPGFCSWTENGWMFTGERTCGM